MKQLILHLCHISNCSSPRRDKHQQVADSFPALAGPQETIRHLLPFVVRRPPLSDYQIEPSNKQDPSPKTAYLFCLLCGPKIAFLFFPFLGGGSASLCPKPGGSHGNMQ